MMGNYADMILEAISSYQEGRSYVILTWREAIIAGLSIPLSFLGAIALLDLPIDSICGRVNRRRTLPRWYLRSYAWRLSWLNVPTIYGGNA